MSPKEAIEALPKLREELKWVTDVTKRFLRKYEADGYFCQVQMDYLDDMANYLWEALRRTTKIASRVHY